MWGLVARLLGGGLLDRLAAAYTTHKNAQTDQERIRAEVAIADIQRQIDAQRTAREVRMSMAGLWEIRLIVATIGWCFTLHLVLVTLDTCFGLGWKIAKFPAPFDQWQGQIILSFFGLQAGTQVVGGLLRALRR